MTGQLYELKIVASGEVRDQDGNLIENVPIESTQTVTEAQARRIIAASADAEDRGI